MYYHRKQIFESFETGLNGIEIGAWNCPVSISNKNIIYVDSYPLEILKEEFPEIPAYPLPNFVIDDVQYLFNFPANSQDFIIANHVFEHLLNPFLAIQNMIRVIKSGGYLFIAIPDKRVTFDKERPITAFNHLFQDYLKGGYISIQDHMREWFIYFKNYKDKSIEEIDALIKEEVQKRISKKWPPYSAHFHVFDENSMLEMFSVLQNIFGYTVALNSGLYGNEVTFVLRKN